MMGGCQSGARGSCKIGRGKMKNDWGCVEEEKKKKKKKKKEEEQSLMMRIFVFFFFHVW